MSDALWTDEQAARAMNGLLVGGKWRAAGVSIDSRQVQPGDIFLAFPGNRVDGHAFVADALSRGAAAAVVERTVDGLSGNPSLIIVENVAEALTGLAIAARKRSVAKFIAITGSVGKTSTKNSLAVGLGEFSKVHSTVGNLNNHIGVPLSLARLHPSSRFAVFELGMNQSGEILELSKLVRPEVAMITNVHSVHLQHFKNESAIADAKGEIFFGLEENGLIVLNQDNQWTSNLVIKANELGFRNIVTFGRDQRAHVQLVKLESEQSKSLVTIKLEDRFITYGLNEVGEHRALNSVGVLACVYALDLDVEHAAKAIQQTAVSSGRGNLIEVPLAKGGSILLIDESYNASPIAMKAAFSVLKEMQPNTPGRKIVVIGDMLELGDDGPWLHADLANHLLGAKPDLIFTVGNLMMQLRASLPTHLCGSHAIQSTDIASEIASELRAGDLILVKGSFGMDMASIVCAIRDTGCQTEGNTMEINGGQVSAI